jgi:hypothetical protein
VFWLLVFNHCSSTCKEELELNFHTVTVRSSDFLNGNCLEPVLNVGGPQNFLCYTDRFYCVYMYLVLME